MENGWTIGPCLAIGCASVGRRSITVKNKGYYWHYYRDSDGTERTMMDSPSLTLRKLRAEPWARLSAWDFARSLRIWMARFFLILLLSQGSVLAILSLVKRPSWLKMPLRLIRGVLPHLF